MPKAPTRIDSRTLFPHLTAGTDAAPRTSPSTPGGDAVPAAAETALRAYAMRPTPAAAPEPQGRPQGVERVGTAARARTAANDLARTTATAGGLLTPAGTAALLGWSGEAGLGDQSASTSAYYTPAALARFMWTLATTLAPARQVLEPSAGGGTFLELAPKDTLITAVEADATSALVLRGLYPHASVFHTPFETFNAQSEARGYQLVIGNPPYGARGATRALDRAAEPDAHWYFLYASLERLAPGGLLCMVVMESMLRNPSDTDRREQLLDHAHVVSVNAVPEQAFRTTGAGVTTAVLTLRRHDAGVSEVLAALTPDERTTLRSRRAENDPLLKAFIDGTLLFTRERGHWVTSPHFPTLSDGPAQNSTRFDQPVLTGDLHLPPTTVETAVAYARARYHGILTRTQTESAVHTLLGPASAARIQRVTVHGHKIPEGTTSACGSYRFRKQRWTHNQALDTPMTLSALHVAQRIVTARAGREPSAAQAALHAHEAHLRTFGPYDLVTLGAAARDLPLLTLLTEAAGNVPRLLQALTPPAPQITPGTTEDVAAQLEAYGLLTPATLAQHAHLPPEAAEHHIATHFAFNGQTWESPGTYYAGNAHERATLAERQAEQHTGLQRQALLTQAGVLRERAPWTDLTDMTLEARDPLVPAPALTDWINAYLGTTVPLQVTPGEPRTPVNLIHATRTEYGVSLRTANHLNDTINQTVRRSIPKAHVRDLEAYLNFRTPVAPVRDQDSKTTEEINAERNVHQENALAWERELATHFRHWALTGPHAPAIEVALNHGRYGLLPRLPDYRPLHLPAYHGPTPHPYQAAHARALARMSGGIGNLDLGLGKTLLGLMVAALLVQSGRARLPAIVVPLSRLGDWIMNAAQALPGFNVLILGGDARRRPDGTIELDDNGEPRITSDDGPRRRQKVARLLAEPFDLVILTMEAFEMIPMLEDTRLRYIETDATLMSGVAAAVTYDDRGRKLAGQRALSVREKFIGRHSLRVKTATPNDVPWEATGIDAIITDEVQAFKSVFAAPSVYGESSPKFLGGRQESNRALDALHKYRFVRARGGSTIGLTASWFTNSPLEIYCQLALHTDALQSCGITDMQSFIGRFCVIEPRLVTEPNGDVTFVPCLVGFRNFDELRSLANQHVLRETEDTCQMHDQVGMTLPPLHTTEHIFSMPDDVQALYDAEQATVDEAERQGPRHLFSIFSRMLKLTLHPPLMGVDAPNARFATCVDACLAARQQGGRNLVFMYTGGDQGETYAALRDMLIAAGYPAREIEIVTGRTHPKTATRLPIERRFRRGELTCVIGSQVIEQGGNYQGCTDLHHLDYPHHWEAFRQRIGRARRQGTWVREIRNHLYFARDSFDHLRYQGMLGKQGWGVQLYDPSVSSCENEAVGFTGDDIAVMLARDPDAKRRAIQQRREERAQQARNARLVTDMATVHEYLMALELLTARHAAAHAREHGPTAQDQAGLARLITRARDLHARMQDLHAGGHPLMAVTRLAPSVRLTWVKGLPLHPGMQFTCRGEPYAVHAVPALPVEIQVRHVRTGTLSTLPATRLTEIEQVHPTPDSGAYTQDAAERLPRALRDAVTRPGPLPLPAAPAGETPPTPAAPPARPPHRYGLSVTAAARPGQHTHVFSIQNGTLVPGTQTGADLVLVDYRAERDVRQVTLVLQDQDRRDRTRQLLLTHDRRLRSRVDQLLQTAV